MLPGRKEEEQIKMRADRLGPIHENVLIYTETDLDAILNQVNLLKPDLVIIDSIQTLSLASLDSGSMVV